MGNKEASLGEKITRRGFLEYLIGGSVAVTFLGALGTVLTYFNPPHRTTVGGLERVEVGPVSELKEGKALLFPYKNKYALIINTRYGFRALEAICSHQGCLLKWDEEKQQIVCPCHGAIFDTKGNVLKGPPPRPLVSYKAEVIGDRIYLGGV